MGLIRRMPMICILKGLERDKYIADTIKESICDIKEFIDKYTYSTGGSQSRTVYDLDEEYDVIIKIDLVPKRPTSGVLDE